MRIKWWKWMDGIFLKSCVFKYFENVFFFNLFYQFVYLFSHWPSSSSFKFPCHPRCFGPFFLTHKGDMYLLFFTILTMQVVSIVFFWWFMMFCCYPVAIYSSASVIPTENKWYVRLFCLSGFVATSVLPKSCPFGFTCTFYRLKAKRLSSFYLEAFLNPKALLRHCIICLHAAHITIKWSKRHTRGFLGSFSIVIILLEYF